MARQQINNTVPIVETDGAGGHVPYVRPDVTPAMTFATADLLKLDYLERILQMLTEIRDEARASRLAIQEIGNNGLAVHEDMLELARTMDIDQEEL
jgi:hypothetical protein